MSEIYWSIFRPEFSPFHTFNSYQTRCRLSPCECAGRQSFFTTLSVGLASRQLVSCGAPSFGKRRCSENSGRSNSSDSIMQNSGFRGLNDRGSLFATVNVHQSSLGESFMVIRILCQVPKESIRAMNRSNVRPSNDIRTC